MNTQKVIPLGNRISQYLGIIGLFLTSFGIIYMFRGNFVYSAVFIGVGLVVLFVIVEQLWKLKTKYKNEGFGVKEVILVVIYLIIAFSSYWIIFHGFNLEYQTKSLIKGYGEDYKQELVTSLPKEYRNAMEKQITSFKIDPNQNSETIATDAEEIKQKLNKELLRVKNRDSLSIMTHYFNINSWNRLELYQSFYELDRLLNKNIDDLKESFTKPTINGWSGREFNYVRQTISNDVISSPFVLRDRLSNEVNYFIPLLIWLICHALILVPYLVSDRGTKVFYDKTYLI